MILICQSLGYNFKNKELLDYALTHPSFYSNKNYRLKANHFERLEFIGDRVLGLIAGDILYYEFPTANEGELARRLAWLVCRDTLAEIAKQMGIHRALKYARATEKNNTQWITFLSDACEAIIGAIYFDGGMVAATQVVTKFFLPLMREYDISLKDPKTQLQEYAQARFKSLPTYTMIQKIGPSHEPEITVECKVKDMSVQAKAGSKKLAENVCAQHMLEILNKI